MALAKELLSECFVVTSFSSPAFGAILRDLSFCRCCSSNNLPGTRFTEMPVPSNRLPSRPLRLPMEKPLALLVCYIFLNIFVSIFLVCACVHVCMWCACVCVCMHVCMCGGSFCMWGPKVDVGSCPGSSPLFSAAESPSSAQSLLMSLAGLPNQLVLGLSHLHPLRQELEEVIHSHPALIHTLGTKHHLTTEPSPQPTLPFFSFFPSLKQRLSAGR